ncbi:putative tetraacyldisaccharide 4'-kinase [Cucumis melo var. makuwa]|uniref:Tetraacyldisaccharide 4'-kinase n=1 Tax=Cucumis melo var. makuwa TaxID=1194695 RepID=A0A5D3E484_CUCMM|nr:putative tetraacyldisaccharide 4'-kinase [Cucumis melo var. makuwa]TYK30381.1 putative tetraacyldisaccharide 4'-kinase [Cucumis melo var. makuwa]
MASSLYKLALSLRHRFYLYGILRKHRSRLTRSQQIWLIILPIPSLDVVFCWVIEVISGRKLSDCAEMAKRPLKIEDSEGI